jgi:hypothetical protein
MATLVLALISKLAEVEAIKESRVVVRAKHLAENIMNQNE